VRLHLFLLVLPLHTRCRKGVLVNALAAWDEKKRSRNGGGSSHCWKSAGAKFSHCTAKKFQETFTIGLLL